MDRISALMDGELDGAGARQELARLKGQSELRDGWNTFHVIGDALRGERLLGTDLSARIAGRLALEPTVLAPRRRALPRIATYALSAAASAAAVALVAWVAVSTQTAVTPQVDVASVKPEPAPVVTASSAPAAATEVPAAATEAPPAAAEASPAAAEAPPVANVPDDGRTNEYLLAHQGFSPSTAIQGIAPYIRSVSASRPDIR